MSRESNILIESTPVPVEGALASDERERKAVLMASAAFYLILIRVCWPSLTLAASALDDQARIAAFRPLSLWQALGHTGVFFFRPGENLLFWLIAHTHSLLGWRIGLLSIFVLTTLYLQVEATLRGGSYVDGFGTALGFSLSPTALSVLCWLSAAHISLCTIGIVTYVAFARRALTAPHARAPYSLCALAALWLALAFYELAMFAPLVVLAVQRWAAPRAPARVTRTLHGAAAVSVSLYLVLQLCVTDVASQWARESWLALLGSSMRYAMRNFNLWFDPFASFGVLIPDAPANLMLENCVCWFLMCLGFALTWAVRKSDPIAAVGGVWFSVFLVPVGTVLHFEGSPIGLQHLYIPFFGVLLGSVRLLTRSVERALNHLRNKLLRLAVEGTLTIVLLWSLAPLIDTCSRSVANWKDATSLYVATLENYPNNGAVLERLIPVLSRPTTPLPVRADAAQPSRSLLDLVLMRAEPESAAVLIARGRALERAGKYTEASGVLARAFVSSHSQQEQLDAGAALAEALSRSDRKALAGELLDSLRLRYPGAGVPLTLEP